MSCADILSSKGNLVCTIESDAPLKQAIEMMCKAKTGSVVVVDRKSGVPSGLVSQSEVLGALDKYGGQAVSCQVQEVMREPLPHCDENLTQKSAMKLMNDEKTRHLVVFGAHGKMTGLVSMGDLVAVGFRNADLEASVLRDMALSRLLAKSVPA